MKSLIRSFEKVFCLRCLLITILVSYFCFYQIFMERVYVKSIKEILGFEVSVVIGIIAILIATAAIKINSTTSKSYAGYRSYQFRTICAGYMTIISAVLTYIRIVVVWGYSETFEVYESWHLLITTTLFVYTLFVSIISILNAINTEQ